MFSYTPVAQKIVDKLGHDEAVRKGLISDLGGGDFYAAGAGADWLVANVDEEELEALIRDE